MAKKKEQKDQVKKEEKDQVKIRILPLRGIGGVGNAGDTAWMDRKEADDYVRDGYVEIITDEEPVVVSSSVASDTQSDDGVEEDQPVEDHAILKPEIKRD